jgi:(E)-4-hydroxy-3-methylbut-2-enyl-diphosphate synthase
MKSAIGIGTLLANALGDTVRVSLTEDPEFEYEPCNRLSEIAESRLATNPDAKAHQKAVKRPSWIPVIFLPSRAVTR